MDPELPVHEHGVNHLNVHTVDLSAGAELTPIILDGVGDEELVKLRQTFRQYLTNSILPDGTPLSRAPLLHPDSNSEQEDLDDTSSDSDAGQEEESAGSRGCACDGTTSRCSVTDGDICECVEQFGNFYSRIISGSGTVLNLDALPNGLPLVECGPDCRCSMRCINRITQAGVQAPIVIRQTSAGLGAFVRPSSPSIPRGTFIALYAGEYLSTFEARDRWRLAKNDNYTLSLRLSGQTIHIDPRYKGNVGRFLNHSCDPNCVILIVYWGASWPRAAIFTKRDVQPGEELTFDYGNASGQEEREGAGRPGGVADPPGRTKCLCGSALCRGFMPFDESL